jgi:hypothetical protein
VLTALPTYVIAVFKMPIGVADDKERIMKNIFRRVSKQERSGNNSLGCVLQAKRDERFGNWEVSCDKSILARQMDVALSTRA